MENRALHTKFKSRAGESFAEVLVAILIAALGLTALASLITASRRITSRSIMIEKNRQASMSTLESEIAAAMGATSSDGTAAISPRISLTMSSGAVSGTVPVKLVAVTKDDSKDGSETLVAYVPVLTAQ